MYFFKRLILFALPVFLLISSCTREDDPMAIEAQNSSDFALATTGTSTPCPTVETRDILTNVGADVGDIVITNTEQVLTVTFMAAPGYELKGTYVYVGDCNQVPMNGGQPDPGQFPLQNIHSPTVASFTYSLPVSSLDSCYCIAANADVVMPGSCNQVIDFNSAGGNPVPAGMNITNQFSANGLTISAQNNVASHPDKAITFDSNNPTGNDFDLGSPNAAFGGPGIGSGGATGMPGENSVPLGNLIIIAENDVDNNNDGLVDDPDDEAGGGQLIFDFDGPAEVVSITLIDLDDGTGGSVFVTEDITGNVTSFPIPDLGENSVETIPVGIGAVDQFVIDFRSSGAVAQITYCPSIATQPVLVNYCTQYCSDCSIEPGEFRTQTQGGWGTNCNGNNPGCYRDANFASCFPNGLVVGCNNTLTLTSSAAVATLLPEGGPPSALSSSLTDPTNTGSVLTGQIVALTLSVTFDQCDPNFGSSNTALGDLVIASGTFQGWTVSQLLTEANAVYGGCPSAYSAAQINSALSSINQNFVDGTMAGNFLDCPNGSMNALPNASMN